MKMIPQMAAYQSNRIGKRRITFGILRCASDMTDTFFNQQMCCHGNDRIQAQQSGRGASDGKVIPLTLCFHPQMSPCFFKRHFHGPATHKPTHALKSRMVKVGRQQGLGFEFPLRVPNQHPANGHWRFARVVPNSGMISGYFNLTWPLPIPLLHLQGRPFGVLIDQDLLPCRTAFALKPRAPSLASGARGSRIIEGGVQVQARDPAGLGQALDLSEEFQSSKAAVRD